MNNNIDVVGSWILSEQLYNFLKGSGMNHNSGYDDLKKYLQYVIQKYLDNNKQKPSNFEMCTYFLAQYYQDEPVPEERDYEKYEYDEYNQDLLSYYDDAPGYAIDTFNDYREAYLEYLDDFLENNEQNDICNIIREIFSDIIEELF